MLREISLEEISDGRTYSKNDMVKVGCNDCKGCSDCCRDMSDSIVLDPYDVYRLCSYLNVSFEGLLENQLALKVIDGVILPTINMENEKKACKFLDEEGRCSVHAARPGICRMFPLGRIYEEDGFSYFLQVHECKAVNKTKVKVKKWLGEEDIDGYEAFILQWHKFIRGVEEKIADKTQLDEKKNLSMQVLTEFYVKGYDKGRDFFEQIKQRLDNSVIN